MSIAPSRAILELWFLTEKSLSGTDSAVLLFVIWLEVDTVLQSVTGVPGLDNVWAARVKVEKKNFVVGMKL